MSIRWTWQGMTILLAAIALDCAGADSGRVRLEAQEEWSNVAGGKDAVFHFSVLADESFQGLAGWQFAVEGRTLSRGEAAVATGPGKPQTIEVRLQVPPTKAGVILATDLSVWVAERPQSGPLTNLSKRIWVFPEDPFAGRKEWLKQLDLRLFDPEKKTALLLTKNEIPFKEVPNLAAWPEIKQGVLIVGEGVSTKEHRGLPEAMIKAAAAGIPVLCLAPAESQLVVPGMGAEAPPHPNGIHLQRNAVIRELDKRLDAESWPPDGKIVLTRWQLKGERGDVVAAATPRGEGWPWAEVRFGAQGRLVLCGFGIVTKWDSGPTPRFLLASILEYLVKNEKDNAKRKEVSE